MTQITINDGKTTITMPKTKKITVGGEIVSDTVEMASGKIVSEIKGFRTAITAEWDYIPASDMALLTTMLRKGLFFTVGYPDPDGTDKSGKFTISIPTPGIFKFVNGVAMWHEVKLKMIAQEVV